MREKSNREKGLFGNLEIVLCLAPCPLAEKISRGDFSKCLRLITGLGCAMVRSKLSEPLLNACPPRLPSATRPFPLLREAGRGYRISLCFRRERIERRAGEARDGRVLGSAWARLSAVTPAKVPHSRPARPLSPGTPSLPARLTRYANARCPPLSCLEKSEQQSGAGGQSGPELRDPEGTGVVPDRPGPQGVAGSGDLGAGLERA